jgi:large subunit ribosomal protein L11
MMEFCKKFNEESKHIVNETPCPVVLSAFSDRTFSFYINAPSTAYLVRLAAGVDAGVARPGSSVGGYISPQAIYEIALIKSKDTSNEGQTLEALCKSIVGTAHSQGIEVRDDVEELEA